MDFVYIYHINQKQSTMKITNFNKQNLKELRRMVAEKFAEIEESTGVKLIMEGITYDSNSFRSKVTAKLMTEGLDEGQNDLKIYGPIHGLSEDDYGKIINFQGEKFKIVGCTNKRMKYVIKAKQLSNGKIYRLPLVALTSNV